MKESIIIPLLNSFHLTPSEKSVCDKYFILYWQISHLRDQIKQGNGQIIREDIHYNIRFDRDFKLPRPIDPETNVRVSFRKLKDRKTGIAIIKLAPRGEQSK